MGVDLCYAWPNSRLAVEVSGLDYRKVYGRGIDEDAYESYLNRAREKVDVFRVAKSWSAQVVDEVIHPAETRQKIIEAIALTREKTDQRPARAKTHGAPRFKRGFFSKPVLTG